MKLAGNLACRGALALRPWLRSGGTLFACWLLTATLCVGGEFNPALNLGDAAPAWEKLPGTDDEQHSLADLADKDAVIVVFTCNSCPVAVDYEDRIIAAAKQHAGPTGRCALVAINVNKIAEDQLPKMKERAAAKGFPFAYLYDDSQEIAKAYGATYTPEFFVLNKQRQVVYMGGMDDNSNVAAVKQNYLEPAIAAALKGEKPAVGETVARGCTIRYQRRRGKN